ncbi:ABCB25 [Symbiodinium natans]|uniref:ABCB25 protein n=1 Tax=Symbiodinium natans TaxID=878477 RepID=A0A812JN36_9DINO|nr:ABCB25 [Symbiodinium natans]
MEDHPWLDGWRELREASAGWCRRLRGLVQQARGNCGPMLPTDRTQASASDPAPAGLIVDVRRGTRIRAWGPPDRLAMCEKAAADAGEFNVSKWTTKSSSLKGMMAWVRRTGPLVWRVLSLLDWRRNMWSSLCVGCCIVIRSACDAWQPVLTGAVFNLVNGDKHEVERESHFLYFLCSWTFGCSGRLPLARSVILGLMLAAVVQGVARVIGDGIKKAMRNKQNSEMRAAMFEHLLVQDQALYDTLRQRDLVRKVELRALSEVTEWVWGMTADTVKLVTQMVFLFAISPLMTLAYTVLLPMMEQIIRRYWERSLRAQLRREDGLNAMSSNVVHEAVSMIKTVKCFSREDKHVALVSIAAKDVMKDTSQDGGPWTSRVRGLKHGVAHLLPDISQRAVYCFCLWCGLVWMERDFSAGDMTAYLLLIQQVGGLVQRVRHQFLELQRRHDLLLDHFEFMDRTPQVVSGMHKAEVGGDIEFREVEFAYPARPDVQVLRGVSFQMARGQMTALVGASGSGKSTIASLLFRHYDPVVGEISIDNVSLCDWDTCALHSQMALVAQQPLLFDTSIRNNLTYGCRRNVPDEEIEAAARMASAHDFIIGFPAGYDTYVGDQGAHISGGQKQRLSIARAVILKPQILVLDEATSALDAEAEGAVQDALDSVMVGRTTLVIAHRLSTIRNAHSIVCMRDGQIVERGSPKELLAKQGYYWSLVRRQVCTLDDLSDFNLALDQHPAETAEGKPCLGDLVFVSLCTAARNFLGQRIHFLDAVMADLGGDYGGVWSKCPVWDGSPLTWRAFKREMGWWTSSLDLEGTRKFNLAARFLMRQSGTVRQRGEEFSPDELEYQKAVKAKDPETGEDVTIVEEDLLAGLNKLMAALEGLNGQSGEGTVVSDMRSEGVKLPDTEVGWFFKEKLGLDALRRQLLDTALQGAEACGTIESECLRLFRDLHLQDPLYRKLEKGSGKLSIRRMFASAPSATPSTAATSSNTSSRRPSTFSTASSLAGSRRGPPRQVHATETEEPETLDETAVDQTEDEAAASDQAGEGISLEEVLQTEALETEIEASAEALVSMREARVKLAEVRKDRGYKGPALNASAAASGGKGRGKAAIAAKKASGKHLCFDCGLPGHWSGDPECTKPGAGLGRAKGKAAPAKQVRIAEACGDANHTVAEVETLNTGENEVLMAMSLSAALRAGSSGQTSEALVTSALAKDKALVGALDSACNRTCAGEDWIQGYLLELQKAPPEIQALVKTVEEQENFKFGNGGNLPSMTRYRVPAVISGHLVGIWISCVPVSSLGLLLGRDLLDGLGGVLDFSQRTLTCKLFANRPPVALERLAAGHLSLALIPEQWPAVTQGRWRKLGADGVLECCIGCAEWAAHLLHMPSVAPLRTARVEPRDLDPDDLVGVRWRRMMLRAVARFDWSREGLRLWCVKHPELRWLPFPYPSVSSVEQWRLQVDGMVANGCYPRKWLGRGVFSQGTLASLTWFRSRVGLKFAFLEDPVLSGMLAARWQPGRMNRIKNAAIKEEAAALARETDRLRAARTLLGPKGGIPTLKADLLKLAALLHTEVADKDTVQTIRDKLRPLVADLCAKVPLPATSSIDSGERSELALAGPSARPSMNASSGTMSPGPSGTATAAATSTSGPLNDAMTVAMLNNHLTQAMEQRFQELGHRHEAMLNQVMHHIMQMHASQNRDEDMMNNEWELAPQPASDPRLSQLGCLEVNRVRQAMLTEVAMQYRKAIHDAFVMEIPLLCTDAVGFNDSVGRCARTRGHITGANLGPEAGWDSYSLATNSKLYDSCNAKSLTS